MDNKDFEVQFWGSNTFEIRRSKTLSPQVPRHFNILVTI